MACRRSRGRTRRSRGHVVLRAIRRAQRRVRCPNVGGERRTHTTSRQRGSTMLDRGCRAQESTIAVWPGQHLARRCRRFSRRASPSRGATRFSAHSIRGVPDALDAGLRGPAPNRSPLSRPWPDRKGINMRRTEDFSDGREAERIARVSALYEAQCHQRASTPAPFTDRSRGLVEVACELKPSVRRRLANRPPD